MKKKLEREKKAWTELARIMKEAGEEDPSYYVPLNERTIKVTKNFWREYIDHVLKKVNEREQNQIKKAKSKKGVLPIVVALEVSATIQFYEELKRRLIEVRDNPYLLLKNLQKERKTKR